MGDTSDAPPPPKVCLFSVFAGNVQAESGKFKALGEKQACVVFSVVVGLSPRCPNYKCIGILFFFLSQDENRMRTAQHIKELYHNYLRDQAVKNLSGERSCSTEEGCFISLLRFTLRLDTWGKKKKKNHRTNIME